MPNYTPAEATKLILERASEPMTPFPYEMTVTGNLEFFGNTQLRELPANLTVRTLNVRNCTALTSLPSNLHCTQLIAEGTGLTSLPSDLQVAYRLDLQNCQALKRLPNGLKVGSLILNGCTALTELPLALEVCFLDLEGCDRLTEFPASVSISLGRLNVRNCSHLTSLPQFGLRIASLNLSGCNLLTALPEGIEISSWLDIARTQIDRLPESLRDVQLRWNGVPIDRRIAFAPETITVDEILAERNAELRRVLLERFGYDRFILQAQAEVLHTDTDPGGERRLLRVSMAGDEDLVCVAVICPSTANQYIIRVPPNMQTCHQAIAWTAGFDDPELYKPLVET